MSNPEDRPKRMSWWKRWGIPVGCGGLGVAFAALAVDAAVAGHGRAAVNAGYLSLVFLFVGGSSLWFRYRVRRLIKRVEAGLCHECGHNLGGVYDKPCPKCYPDGDPNFLASDADDQEVIAWLRRQSRQERRGYTRAVRRVWHADLGLRSRTQVRNVPIVEDDGSIVFVDAYRTSRRVLIGLVAFFVVLMGSAGWLGYVAGAPNPSLGNPSVLSIVIPILIAEVLPAGALVWVVLRIRAERSRSRVLTISSAVGSVTRENISRRNVETQQYFLDECWFTLSELLGPNRMYAVIFWTPDPFLLAMGRRENELERYIESFPSWLQAYERIDPGYVEVSPRRVPEGDPEGEPFFTRLRERRHLAHAAMRGQAAYGEPARDAIGVE